MNRMQFLLNQATIFDVPPTDEEMDKIVEAIHWIDARLCRSGVSDDHDGSRARHFWQMYLENGVAVFYVSDGGYSRLCLSIWNTEDGSPTLELDRSLSTPYSLERWSQICAGTISDEEVTASGQPHETGKTE